MKVRKDGITTAHQHQHYGHNRGVRVRGLLKKEVLQVLRDPSSILIAFILPLVMLFLFAYGVSLDLREIKIGVVLEQGSPKARDLLAAFEGSPYYQVRTASDRRQLQPLLVGGRLHAVVIIPADFDRRAYRKDDSPVQVIVRGTDANTGELVQYYIEATWRRWLSQQETAHNKPGPANLIDVNSRVWFNEEVESRAALIPGSLAVIMTLIGTMLTSLVVAREWERGTMEALLSTPVTRGDLLLCKFVPYFLLGITAMTLVTAISTWGLGVPLRGSFGALLIVTSAFLVYALGLGLLISAVAENQFVATQGALIVGFLPALILSGLVFEIDSMPWPIRALTYLFAPRYFVSSLKTLFLAGNVWQIIVPQAIIMALLGAMFLMITARKMPETLETGQ